MAQPSTSARSPPHQLTILNAGLGLVGVAAQVVRLAIARLHERPLETGRKAGAAAAAQAGFLDDVHDVAGAHVKRLLERFIAPTLFPAGEGASLGVPKVLGEDGGVS
jgi:hypothetical protein